jgi:5-methylcytosine-specific restriction protein A
MAREFAKKFYNSKQWKKCRSAYIQSVFGLCEKCQRPGWIVHHKIVLTPENINNPEVTLNWEHLELLCLDCHNREHGKGDKSAMAEGLMFDEYGDLVLIPPL